MVFATEKLEWFKFIYLLVALSSIWDLSFLLLLLLLLLSRFSRVRLCVTPVDGSPPGSPVPGILQARTLEWVAISFSNAWKWKVKVKSLSRVRLFVTPCGLPGSSVHGIFLTKDQNLWPLHWKHRTLTTGPLEKSLNLTVNSHMWAQIGSADLRNKACRYCSCQKKQNWLQRVFTMFL